MRRSLYTQLSPADLLTFFVAGMAGILAGNLTVLTLIIPEHFLDTLRAPMMPGLYAAWRFFGNANGDVFPTVPVLLLSVFINAFVYAAVVMVPRLLWCHVSRPAERRSGRDRRATSRPVSRHGVLYEDRRRLAA